MIGSDMKSQNAGCWSCGDVTRCRRGSEAECPAPARIRRPTGFPARAAVDDFRHRGPQAAQPIGRHVAFEHEIAIAEIGSALVLGKDQGVDASGRPAVSSNVPSPGWCSLRHVSGRCRAAMAVGTEKRDAVSARTRPHLRYAALFGNAHVTVPDENGRDTNDDRQCGDRHHRRRHHGRADAQCDPAAGSGKGSRLRPLGFGAGRPAAHAEQLPAGRPGGRCGRADLGQ